MPNQIAAAPSLDDIPFHFARLGIAFARLSSQTLKQEGLAPQAPGVGSVLHALFEEDDIPARQLSELTHLPKGTLTGVLDRLEAAGWIKRHPDPDDRRAWRVRLTARGRALERKMRRRHARVMKVLTDALGERDLLTLTRLLAKTTTAIRQATQAAAPE